MEFLINNLEIVLFVVGVIILSILWFLGKKNVVKSVLLQFVIDAEAKYGSGTGGIKHPTVVGWVKQKFPTFFLLISDKTLDKWIGDMVQYIKNELGEEAIQKSAGSVNQLKANN